MLFCHPLAATGHCTREETPPEHRALFLPIACQSFSPYDIGLFYQILLQKETTKFLLFKIFLLLFREIPFVYDKKAFRF